MTIKADETKGGGLGIGGVRLSAAAQAVRAELARMRGSMTESASHAARTGSLPLAWAS
jgi:hypothetical protein